METAELNDISPITRPDQRSKRPESGIALCLSGGGFRATIFHIGALWRLNELRILSRLARVSSVSGGSITAATLGMNWRQLGFTHPGDVASRSAFEQAVVSPLRALARETIDVSSVGWGILSPFSTIADQVAFAYAKHLYGKRTLQDLPADGEGPRFVLNATNVKTGSLWRFSRPYMADYRVGKVNKPKVSLATVVAASSAFPPFLSPLILPVASDDYDKNDQMADLVTPEYRANVMLSDGGVYDNLGLETAYKNYDTLLVSDGGRRMAPEPAPSTNWGSHAYRLIELLQHQTSNLRRRMLIHSYQQWVAGQPLAAQPDEARQGAYFGIQTNITALKLPIGEAPLLVCDPSRTAAIAAIDTRLAELSDTQQEELINWGYAICDAGVRTFYRGFAESFPKGAAVPAPEFPYPGHLLA